MTKETWETIGDLPWVSILWARSLIQIEWQKTQHIFSEEFQIEESPEGYLGKVDFSPGSSFGTFPPFAYAIWVVLWSWVLWLVAHLDLAAFGQCCSVLSSISSPLNSNCYCFCRHETFPTTITVSSTEQKEVIDHRGAWKWFYSLRMTWQNDYNT